MIQIGGALKFAKQKQRESSRVMNFEGFFKGPAVLSKQLELRWTDHGTNANNGINAGAVISTFASARRKGGAKNCPRPLILPRRGMPYLRRNLLYCRDPIRIPRFPRWIDVERSADDSRSLPKEDMLFKIFGHRGPDMSDLTIQKINQLSAGTFGDQKSVERVPKINSGGRAREYAAAKAIVSCNGNELTKGMKSGIHIPERKKEDTSSTSNVSGTASTHACSTPSRKRKRCASGSNSPQTKLYYDVEMAQSPLVALSPSTVEMKYGKAFPAYEPRDLKSGKWSRPADPKSAFAMFSESTRKEAKSLLQRRTRSDEGKIEEQLQELWSKASSTSQLYWKQEEEWDKQRHMHELAIYNRARQLAGNAIRFEEKKETGELDSDSAIAKALAGVEFRSKTVSKKKPKIDSTQLGQSEYEQTKLPPRRVSRVYFHYFHSSQSIASAQVERRNNARCPLCYENCVTDIGLLMHCQLVHNDSLSFNAMKDEDANLHIGVHSRKMNDQTFPRKNACAFESNNGVGLDLLDAANSEGKKPPVHSSLENFVFWRGEKHPDLVHIPFIKRSVKSIATMSQSDRRKKGESLRRQGAREGTVKRLIPDDQVPIRQYFHSKTSLPMREGEWDEDSDDESTDSWMGTMSEKLLDDFEDVSDQEKRFLNMWNRFMRVCSDTIVSDRSIPNKCLEFLKLNGDEIKKLDLRQNLFLHLCNLWDESILSADHVSRLMTFYDLHIKSTGGTYGAPAPHNPSKRREKTP